MHVNVSFLFHDWQFVCTTHSFFIKMSRFFWRIFILIFRICPNCEQKWRHFSSSPTLSVYWLSFLFVRNCDITYIQHIFFIPLIIYRSTDNPYVCAYISMKNIISTCTYISHIIDGVFLLFNFVQGENKTAFILSLQSRLQGGK